MKQTENYGFSIYEPNDVTSYLSESGWNGTMSKIDATIKTVSTLSETNATDVSTLEAQVTSQSQQITTLNTDVENLKTTAAGNTANIAGLSTRVVNLETEVEELKQTASGEAFYSGTLSTGETTLAIEIGEFTNDSLVDVYSSVYGVNPLTIELRTASSGTPNLCVTTWDEQSVDVSVTVKITNVKED